MPGTVRHIVGNGLHLELNIAPGPAQPSVGEPVGRACHVDHPLIDTQGTQRLVQPGRAKKAQRRPQEGQALDGLRAEVVPMDVGQDHQGEVLTDLLQRPEGHAAVQKDGPIQNHGVALRPGCDHITGHSGSPASERCQSCRHPACRPFQRGSLPLPRRSSRPRRAGQNTAPGPPGHPSGPYRPPAV